jgi:hypothetical protein
MERRREKREGKGIGSSPPKRKILATSLLTLNPIKIIMYTPCELSRCRSDTIYLDNKIYAHLIQKSDLMIAYFSQFNIQSRIRFVMNFDQ